MRNQHYPSGSVRALLNTDLVKQNTHAVLKSRLERAITIVPVFFDAKAFEILSSVCKRLIPQNGRPDEIDLPGLLDEHLAAGKSKGWRFNQIPPDKIIYKAGLYGIDETAELMYKQSFIFLEETEQDKVLSDIQSGKAEGKTWEQIPAPLFFQEVLASLTEFYYSHPIAKEEIGEVAFADEKGWQKIGLNELEAHEPKPLKHDADDK